MTVVFIGRDDKRRIHGMRKYTTGGRKVILFIEPSRAVSGGSVEV